MLLCFYQDRLTYLDIYEVILQANFLIFSLICSFEFRLVYGADKIICIY